MYKQRRKLALLLVVISNSVIAISDAKERRDSQLELRPNIVLIIAANQSTTLLGAYGNKEIATPNIDALAR